MTGAEKTAADFVAIVKQVLATVLESMEPPPVIRPEDVDVVAGELVKRIMAVYPRRRPLIGLPAIVDEYGADSYLVRHARFLMGLHQFGIRYRGLRHRELMSLPAPLVKEPDLDAVAAGLVELYRLRHGLRHREVEARSDVTAA